MKKKFRGVLLLVLLLSPLFLHAQQADSLWVKVLNNRWQVLHRVKEGETLFQIARQYQVPPAELARENGISYSTGLGTGTVLYIPIGLYNRISQGGVAGSRPVYYKTTQFDDWQRIAFLSGTSAAALREWNNLPMRALKEGQVLLVGWVKYEAAPATAVKPVTVNPVVDPVLADTVTRRPPARPAFEEEFLAQAGDGGNIATEKGPAIYYDSKTGGSQCYAFFNMAPRGTIIKIVNPGNGHYVYAKVIGTIPENGRFENAVVGLSLNAQRTLGGTGRKTWCEVHFPGY